MSKPNITWLTDTLATGGDLSYDLDIATMQQEALVAAGVTHVLDLRIEDNDVERWFPYQVHYLNLATTDAEGHHIDAALFDNAVAFAQEADQPGGKLLVHCHMGVNRGPSAAAAVLMDRGMTGDEAFRLIREKRPQAAVYYLMDAYDAHWLRRGEDPPVGDRERLLRVWEDTLGDPTIIKHVTRYIAQQHKADREFFRR